MEMSCFASHEKGTLAVASLEHRVSMEGKQLPDALLGIASGCVLEDAHAGEGIQLVNLHRVSWGQQYQQKLQVPPGCC